MLKYAKPQMQKEIRISVEEFIKLFNEDKAVLVDMRMPFEKKVWKLPFALDIHPDNVEEKLDELSKDKVIVCACPTNNRSPFMATYLKEKGYDAKYLVEGLLKLMEKLKGGEAKKLKV